MQRDFSAKTGGISSNALKLLALLTMTVDHVGLMFFPRLQYLRIIGRLAFPIFAYCIAEGCFYTRHPLRYFLSVFGVGLLCQIVYFVVDRSLYLCILITFSLSILTIYGIRFLKQSIKGAKIVQTVLGVLWVAAVLALSYFLSYPPVSPRPYGLRVDYNFFGVLTPVIVYLMPNRWAKLIGLALGLILVALDLGGIQWYALLALLPLAFYRGARGRWKLKYLFYIYYPLHLAALYGIALLLI